MLSKRLVFYDGAKGTWFMQKGYDQVPETLLFDNPDLVHELSKAYADRGANLIQTNSFSANSIALEKHGLLDKQKEIIWKAIEIAKEACKDEEECIPVFVMGPSTKLMVPSGDLTFADAYGLYSFMVKEAYAAGARYFHFETFSDLYEMKIAVLAAKDLQENFEEETYILASMAFENNGKTLMGDSPEDCARLLTKLRVSALGANCSFAPSKMIPIIVAMASKTSLPIIAKPNCGLPQNKDGQIVYNQTPESFAVETLALAKAGANIIGGCCGTSPDYIEHMVNLLTKEEKAARIPRTDARKIEKDERCIAPVICYPKDWQEDSLFDIAFDILDSDNEYICVYGTEGDKLTEATNILRQVLKKDIYISSDNPVALEEAIRTASCLPDIFVTKEVATKYKDELEKLVNKYGICYCQG